MEKETIIEQAVKQAYDTLTGVADVNAYILGGYFGAIIPESQFKKVSKYTNEIIDFTFWELCNEITSKITNDDMKCVIYRSFCFNEPNELLIKDCFNIVNNIIINKKSSDKPTLASLLESLREKHSEQELEKSFDTIFDILLNYYSIIKK